MRYELTLVEAQAFMQKATGASWTLPRLIGAGARVAVWLEPPPNAARALIDAVFMGGEAGFVAQVVEGADLQRLAFTRGDGTLTFARRPDGQVVRMSPPARFGADELRFDADDLRALAARVGVTPIESAPAKALAAPQTRQVEPAIVYAAPNATVHRAQRRSDPLAAVISLAKRGATDAKDWQSVWPILVSLAKATERPAPLLGYTEGEGVKYETFNERKPVVFLTREALRRRFGREAQRPPTFANVRQRT